MGRFTQKDCLQQQQRRLSQSKNIDTTDRHLFGRLSIGGPRSIPPI